MAPSTRQLPEGTVTFVFTDIEGSTRLLAEVGDRGYGELLVAHRELIRSIVEGHGGVELGTEGDAFFLVFADAPAAVEAAVAMQDELAGGELRIRVGIHTGEPLVIDDDYVGIDIHKAARICSAAHGGQVLLSAETRARVERDGNGRVVIRDLGFHRLKDLTGAQRLFQLGEREFPAPRALRRGNLPAQPAPLLGRGR
jgi:class 3 adenylate cyclase